jgi:hypothetical protein
MLYPGDTLVVDITTHYPDTGGLVDADDLSVVLRRNGLDTVVTVDIVHAATGVYTASAEIPETWEQGDAVWFLVTATVDGTTANAALGYNVLAEPPAPVDIPVSDPGFVTGYYICYSEDGELAPGIEIQVQLTKDTSTGFSHSTNIRTIVSDDEGVAVIANMVPGATYKLRGGVTRDWFELTVPLDTDPVALNTLLRKD